MYRLGTISSVTHTDRQHYDANKYTVRSADVVAEANRKFVRHPALLCGLTLWLQGHPAYKNTGHQSQEVFFCGPSPTWSSLMRYRRENVYTCCRQSHSFYDATSNCVTSDYKQLGLLYPCIETRSASCISPDACEKLCRSWSCCGFQFASGSVGPHTTVFVSGRKHPQRRGRLLVFRCNDVICCCQVPDRSAV